MTLEEWQQVSDIERLMCHLGLSADQKKIIYGKLSESLDNLVSVKKFLLKKFLDKMKQEE